MGHLFSLTRECSLRLLVISSYVKLIYNDSTEPRRYNGMEIRSQHKTLKAIAYREMGTYHMVWSTVKINQLKSVLLFLFLPLHRLLLFPELIKGTFLTHLSQLYMDFSLCLVSRLPTAMQQFPIAFHIKQVWNCKFSMRILEALLFLSKTKHCLRYLSIFPLWGRSVGSKPRQEH